MNNPLLVFCLFLLIESILAASTSNPSTKKTSEWKELLAGAMASIIEILITQPFEVIKTKAQTSETVLTNTQIASEIISKQGISGLYTGLEPEILKVVPWRSVRFFMYALLKNLLTGGHPSEATFFLNIVAGVGVGISEAFVITPFEVVKVALIADRDRIERHYNGLWNCAKKIYKKNGYKGLYAGILPTCLRQILFTTAYFISYLYSKPLFAQLLPFPMVPLLFAGFLAGVSGTILNTPVDVIKTRMQKSDQVNNKITGTIQGIAYIARHESVGALYSGLSARILKNGVGAMVGLPTYEFFKYLMQ
ncbi:mitochondrial 2-oxodicarboxylate carrier ODC [Acrasis kona]|uniref:Mitochondrial 2-oxodicarboxylate carrier ODC n=1 Tax=Acrasis kona TaxID=1008807 RepID=A0AAW2YM48_9EUKA